MCNIIVLCDSLSLIDGIAEMMDKNARFSDASVLTRDTYK